MVVIFAVIAVATWLRPFNHYAFWAAGVTSVLALLYGYFGETGTTLLGQRLEGIALGAGIGIAASWFVLPIRTRDVMRRRTADALAALSEVLATITTTPTELAAPARRFEHAVRELDRIAKPLEAHRLLYRLRRPDPHAADVFDASRSALVSVRELVSVSAADPSALREPAVTERTAAILLAVRRARQAIGGRPLDPAPAGNPPAVTHVGLERALGALDAAAARLAGTAIAALAPSASALSREGSAGSAAPSP